MSTTGTALLRWHDGVLEPRDDDESTQPTILAADSWLVRDGSALALQLHRERFFAAVDHQLPGSAGLLGLDDFWATAIASIPRRGNQFPRVELQQADGEPRLVCHRRPAPGLSLSVAVATHQGTDPRTQPTVKGPDTHSLLAARTDARRRGAGEAVILSPDGSVIEGTSSALVWWRGEILCYPSPELERVDSVTARSVVTLASALGLDVYAESVGPDELAGLEVWALSALHGIRIVTGWVDGPALAEQPGRLAAWRSRLDRLRKPLPDLSAG